jgi:hypothetical protein
MNDDQYWDQEVGVEEEQIRQTTDAPGSFIRVNGANISVQPGADAVESIKATARDAGLGKFRVYYNGSEVKPSEIPAQINEGAMIELRPYDVAG